MKIGRSSHEAIFSRKKVASKNKNKKVLQKQLSNWTPLQADTLQQTTENSSKTQEKNSIPPNPNEIQSEKNISTSAQNIEVVQPKPDPLVTVNKNNKESQPIPASEISRELLRIKGTWPFDMAPDELIIEEKRIIIKRNNFPVGGSVITLPLKKLTSFEVNHAILYSALYIKGEGNTLNYVMQWLKPEDALRAKEVIDGLRLQESEFVEIKDKDPQKIVETLQSLGQT